ncbi:hypothetical protein G3480_08815 [Thiorhodococcus mannitoliphagus]|uniref:DUF8082 domain-containing protein n=1 Tax=Thiorhodococcus mannitoliphagus TaxID=329406 RepID=A0A6P1DQU6_9GAMM|nr:hypothetical protein [Thiorhodococcus mannitoliphagus]NEX20408.1 hypothetical protein [Thiorhodococcus mannitoliphagus]
MSTPYLSFSEITKALSQLCSDGATGTLFVATDANRSAQVKLNRGLILYVSYANKRGEEALDLIPSISAGRYRFQEGSIGGAQMDLPTTASILARFEQAAAATDAADPAGESDAAKATQALGQREREILRSCLAEFVGPIAELVCDDHFDHAADLRSAIDALATEISSDPMAQQFRAMVAKQLG